MLRLLVACAVAAVTLLTVFGPSEVLAEGSSPSITPARTSVQSLLAPGGRHEVASLVVRNPGTDPMPVRMSVQADSAEVAAWVRLDPETFEVSPGGAQVVRVALDLPGVAPLGDYRIRVRAGAVRPAGDGHLGVGLSVGVASIIDFELGLPEDGAVIAVAAHRSSTQYVPMALLVGLGGGILGYYAASMLKRFREQFRVALRLEVVRREERDDDSA